MAYNPLTMTLGGMFIDSAFRLAMTEDMDAALSAHRIELTATQRESAERMVASFECGELDESVMALGRICPTWPCPRFKMALAPERRRQPRKKRPTTKRPTTKRPVKKATRRR